MIATSMSFEKFIPTRLIFGSGSLNALHRVRFPGTRALLLTSSGSSVKRNGTLERVEKQLQRAGVSYEIFPGIEANPLNRNINEGAAFAVTHRCDFIIALGGGSVMDAGKCIATAATNGGDFWDYMRAGTGKSRPITIAPLPLICITTTAGTGSEIDRGAALTNEVTQEKLGLKTEELYPVLSIADPELTLTVPPSYTLYQGFDALSHCMEGYVSHQANVMCDIFAIAGVEHVGRHLARAVKNGSDLDAREHVLLGSSLAGMVMSTGGVTSLHALEDTLSGFHHDLPHGAGLIILARAYFGHMIERHVCDERFIRLARALGMEQASKPGDFLTALSALLTDCGADGLAMSDYGITPDEFAKTVSYAKTVSARLFTHDLQPLSDDDCHAILVKSYR